MAMSQELQNRVLTRLFESNAADQPWALVLLAAMEGAEALQAFLAGGAASAPVPPAPTPEANGAQAEKPGVYVTRVTVEGFRGVGRSVALDLTPGPGLTLVVGRNGSGKSSFAEGLELLLTGRNTRWESPRAKVWREGWRNLHTTGRVLLRADLLVEGSGPLTLTREWTGGGLDDGQTMVGREGQLAMPLAGLGWAPALDMFRPFLSYNELGSLLEDGPSKLYDALSRILGLEELVQVQELLAETRKSQQAAIDAAKKEASALSALAQTAAGSSSDPRLASVASFKWGSGDLASLEALLAGAADATSAVDVLNRVRALPAIDLELTGRLVGRLRDAEQACAAFDGTDAARSRELAELLEASFRFYDAHMAIDCPVCGTGGVLSPAWRGRAASELARLREAATAYEAAISQRTTTVRTVQRFIVETGALLAEASSLGLPSLDAALAARDVWMTGRDVDAAPTLAAHLEQHGPALAQAFEALVAESTTEAARRDELWQPIAQRLAAWLPSARAAYAVRDVVAQVKKAEDWWKDALAATRAERFEPIADSAMAIWRGLRLQSNVDLGGIALEGSGPKRRVELGATVDGTATEAISVMSQGELHSLALSLFLPRATLAQSPFRFVWIDDPVQSMDPARVDGLARALHQTARTRQVVVFTHDDRLPEAVRRLGIAADVLAVSRGAQSVVDVRRSTDPVTAALDDARALAKTDAMPRELAARAIGGFCRAAVEAACMEKVRRRRLASGALHQDVEALLSGNTKLHPLMALALFDDERKTSDVFTRLNREGHWAGDVFRELKEGAHAGVEGHLLDLVRQTEALTRLVDGLPE